jgi:hypothetical protein
MEEPTLVMYRLKLNESRGESKNLFVRFQRGFEKGFEQLRRPRQARLISKRPV